MDKPYYGEVHVQFTYNEEVEADCEVEAEDKLETLARKRFKDAHILDELTSIESITVENIQTLEDEE